MAPTSSATAAAGSISTGSPTDAVPGMQLFRPALERTLDRLHAHLRLVAAYHRGWVDAEGRPDTAGGGKAIRPALALLGALAAGRDPSAALPGAVAVELVHDFSLLHDDVIDDDRIRRHRPTAWTVFGVPSALLAGDALVALATAVITEVPGEPGRVAGRLLSDALQRLMSGQTDDLAFETRMDVTFADYLDMAGGKTAALLSCSCSIGAALAGGSDTLVSGLAEVGERLGLAFQLVDDLLAMWGEPSTTGKPVLSDLRARKKSAPIACALESRGARVDRLRGYLSSTGPVDDETLRDLATVVEAAGRRRVEEEAGRQLAAAEQRLTDLALPPAADAQLRTMARYITRRDR
jgi:geranylgeranyl diphosphate synthase type I